MNANREPPKNRNALERTEPSHQTQTGAQDVSLELVGRRSLEEWADRINSHLRKSVEELIAAGMDLKAAKAELGRRREWIKLFERGLVKIHLREAERLMQVIDNEAIANPTNWSNLPQSLQALCALSPVKPAILAEAITAGVINPRTTIKQAREFRSQHDTKHRKKSPLLPGPENQPSSQTVVFPGGFGRQDKAEFRILPIAVKWEGANNWPPELSELVGEAIFDALKRLEPWPAHLRIGQGQQKDEIQVSLQLELCNKELVSVRTLSVLEIVAATLSRGFAAYPPELRGKFREQVLLMVGALDPRHDITPAFLLGCVKWFSSEKGSHPS